MGSTLRGISIALTLAVAVMAPSVAVASPGDLDPDFSGDGIKRLNGYTFAGLVKNDPQGGVIVEVNGNRLVRLGPSGRIDRGFADNGVLETGLAVRSPFGILTGDFAVGPDGHIVVIGQSSGRILLRAFDPDGSVAGSFGSGGTVELSDQVAPTANFVRVDDEGRPLALVTGNFSIPAQLSKFSPLGEPVDSFGDNGVVHLDPDYSPAWLELGSDGTAYVASASHQNFDGLVVLKLRPEGTLDDTYGGGDGIAVPPDPGLPYYGGRVEVTADGTAHLLTRVIYTPHLLTRPGLSRLDPTGAIDPAAPEVNGLQGGTSAELLAIGPSGEAITGITNSGKPSPQERLVAVTDTGEVDADFGYGGPSSFFAEEGPTLDSYAAAFDRGLPVSFYGITEATDANVTVAGLSGTRKGTGPHVAEVARFQLDDGLDDADADGSEDVADACPLDFGKTHLGCPLLTRSIRMNTKRLLHGTVETSDPRCANGFTIRLIDRSRGRIVDRSFTEGAIGRWGFDHRVRDGDYSLRLRASRLDDRLVCSGARFDLTLLPAARR